jgi:hypothetical protein
VVIPFDTDLAKRSGITALPCAFSLSSVVVARCRHLSTSDGLVTPGQPVTAPT